MKDLWSSIKTALNWRVLFRHVVELLFALSLTQLAACGGYGNRNMASTSTGTTVVNGTVSSVTLTSVANGSGGMMTATAVRLNVLMGMNSVVLCGDQRSSFAMNASVQVSYTSGLYCSNLVSVKPV